MEIKSNTPIEVNKLQYSTISRELGGICAHRVDEKGRYWVCLWYSKPIYKFILNKILNG